METWDLASLDVAVHQPLVLTSDDEIRLVAIDLPAGEELKEHQTHERTLLVVASGRVELGQGDSIESGGPGFLAAFDPNERREVRATEHARILLVLAPWPGVGHPRLRNDASADAAA